MRARANRPQPCRPGYGTIQDAQSVAVVGAKIVGSQDRPEDTSPVTQNFRTCPAETRWLDEEEVAIPALEVVAVLVERSFVPRNHWPVTETPESTAPASFRTVTEAVAVALFDAVFTPVTVTIQ